MRELTLEPIFLIAIDVGEDEASHKVFDLRDLFIKIMLLVNNALLIRSQLHGYSLSKPLLFDMVGVEGFEPPTSYSQSKRATRLRYTPTPLITKSSSRP